MKHPETAPSRAESEQDDLQMLWYAERCRNKGRQYPSAANFSNAIHLALPSIASVALHQIALRFDAVVNATLTLNLFDEEIQEAASEVCTPLATVADF